MLYLGFFYAEKSTLHTPYATIYTKPFRPERD